MFREYPLIDPFIEETKSGRKYAQALQRAAARLPIDFPHSSIEYENEVRIRGEIIEDFLAGNLPWTVRYKPGVIRLLKGKAPLDSRVNVIQTSLFSPKRNLVGYVHSIKVAVGRVRDWSKDHPSIRGCGCKNKREMIDLLKRLYDHSYPSNPITDDSVIQAYEHLFPVRKK